MNDLLNTEPVKRVIEALSKFNKNLKVQILEKTARTARDAATALNCAEGAIVKSLVFRSGEGFLVCLVSGDKKCSLNKVKKLVFQKDVCMGNAEDVKAQTGFTIGGVSPVGHLKELDILIDKNLNRFDQVFAAAGHPNSIFEIDFSMLIDLTRGRIEDITE